MPITDCLFTSCKTPLLLTLLLVPWSWAHSQESPSVATSPTLETVSVSASALSLGSDAMSTPVTVLEEDELLLRREATIGETLGSQPGIHASHFGAGASRPIIRGMDGPRVKMLSDGAEIQDASTLSPDHAVAAEPMLAEQIEVLRGPAALAYGGGAIGGVVNVLDRKIPTAMPANGLEGSLELRANSGAREHAGAFEITAGTGNIAVHAEGVQRHAGDYRTGSGWPQGRRVDDSGNQTDTASLGVSWIGQQGFAGVAYTRQRADYGLPGHVHAGEDCHPHGTHLHCGSHAGNGDDDHDHDHAQTPFVQLDSQRWDLRGEYREPFAGFARLRVRAGVTDYQHQEIEGEHVATTFTNQAHDGRLELEHHPLGGWRGVLGVQTSRRDFKAVGEEAYVDPTLTRKHAIFLVEEMERGDWRFEAGARQEWQAISVQNPALRNTRHAGSSLSLGAVWSFLPRYSLGISLSRVQRLPSAEELYADGVHMATRTYELGNPDLKKETAHNLDVSLRKQTGDTTFSVSAFHNRIRNYIHASTLDNQEGFQLIAYRGRDVIFQGVEGEVRRKLSNHLDGTVFGDYVHARLDRPEQGNSFLPRIPAHRFGLKLEADWAGWSGLAEWFRVGSQNRVAALEQATPGYDMLNVSVQHTLRAGGTRHQFYIKANNLLDKLAYSHASFVKTDAPLMGRSITLGVRTTF